MKLKLYNGDCLKVLPKLPARSVDVVVCSPPYNIGLKYKTYSDSLSDEEYLSWLVQVGREIKRVLKTSGSFFLNIAGTSIKPLLPHQALLALAETFVLQNTIVWTKSITVDGITRGHFKPLNSERYINNNFEYIYHLTKTGSVALDRHAVGVPYTDKSNMRRQGHTRDVRCRGNTWFIPYTTRQTKLAHPASFPVELPEWCIRLHGKKRAVVLDCFSGSATTGVAAYNVGAAAYIGIESDGSYYRLGRKRLTNHMDASND